MLRRSKKFLLIGLMAMWTQIFASLLPYMAIASADPIASVEICLSISAADGLDHGSDQKGGSPACILHCALIHASFTLLGSPETTSSVPVRSVERTVWAEHRSNDGIDRLRTPAQARAPPLFS